MQRDHTGDISLFPNSTDLYVGPGFKEAFMPGYPSKKDSPMLESDFKYVKQISSYAHNAAIAFADKETREQG